MSDRQDERGARRAYAAPQVRVVELDVMASFPDNCKMASPGNGFGGVGGSCTQSSQPNVMCLNIGS